jgi:hypothetical protein
MNNSGCNPPGTIASGNDVRDLGEEQLAQKERDSVQEGVPQISRLLFGVRYIFL